MVERRWIDWYLSNSLWWTLGDVKNSMLQPCFPLGLCWRRAPSGSWVPPWPGPSLSRRPPPPLSALTGTCRSMARSKAPPPQRQPPSSVLQHHHPTALANSVASMVSVSTTTTKPVNVLKDSLVSEMFMWIYILFAFFGGGDSEVYYNSL